MIKKYFDTDKLENAYHKRNGVVDISHWYGKVEGIYGDRILLTNADKKAKIIDKNKSVCKLTGKPFWWLPVVQLENRLQERLDMNFEFDTCLIYCHGRYPNIFPKNIKELELIARKKPKKDWRVEIIEAFESLTFQRQGRNKWLLVSIGKGYA